MFTTEYFVVRSNTASDFVLMEPLQYHGLHQTFIVPAGWLTDFASVPQILTWMLPRYGVYTRAAILHDYLCDLAKTDTPIVSRADADGIFRRVLREMGVSFFVRWMMWAAVRASSFMTGARFGDWVRFLLVLVFAVPFLLIPTIIVGFWMLIFKLLDLLGR